MAWRQSLQKVFGAACRRCDHFKPPNRIGNIGCQIAEDKT
jgi:hypothetical protein